MEYTKNQLSITKIASKSNLRPEISNVLFDNNKAVATDSYRLIEIINKNVFVDKTTKSSLLLVNAEYLKNIRLPKKQDKVYINKDENDSFAELTSGSLSIKLPLLLGADYPDYKKLIPDKDPKYSLSVNATYLKELCDLMEHIKGLSDVELQLYDNLIVLKAESNSEKAVALLMPMRI